MRGVRRRKAHSLEGTYITLARCKNGEEGGKGASLERVPDHTRLLCLAKVVGTVVVGRDNRCCTEVALLYNGFLLFFLLLYTKVVGAVIVGTIVVDTIIVNTIAVGTTLVPLHKKPTA